MASSSSCGQERDHGSGAAEHPKHIRDKRRDIILKIKEIKPVSGKNLKDVEVPGELYQLAKVVAREESAVKRFTKVEVYRLLLNHAQSNNCAKLEQTEALLDGWELASKALFRYALNLVLAPKTPEFKKMKLSSSFYVYNIARKLPGSKQVFLVMGYKQQQGEGQVLEYEGDVNIGAVLETATDLLIMCEEVRIIREEVKLLYRRGMGQGVLEKVIMDRSEGAFQQGFRIVARDGPASHGDGQLQVHGLPRAPYGQQYSFQERGEAKGVDRSRKMSEDLLTQRNPVQVNDPLQAGPTLRVECPAETSVMYASPSVTHAYPNFPLQQQQQPQQPQQHEQLHHQTHNAYAGNGKNYGASPLNKRGAEGCWDTPKASWVSDGNAQKFLQRDGVQQQNMEGLQGTQQAGYQPRYPSAGKNYANVGTVPLAAIGYGGIQSDPDSTIYQNVHGILQVEPNLENISVLFQVQSINKQNSPFPPLVQQDTEEEDLYGDDIAAPPSTPPNSPLSNSASFDPANLPGPIVNLEDSGYIYSGITSSLVDTRSSGEGGRLSPMDEQPQGLGDAINEEHQSMLEQFSSTGSKKSLDLYESGSFPCPRWSLQKLPSVNEEPVDSKQHGKSQTPTFQVGSSQDKTAHPPQQQIHPVPKPRVPRAPRTQQKSHSVDELKDSDKEIHHLKISLSGSNLVKYDALSSTEKLFPTRGNHSSSSPTSSPFNSPKPARRKVVPVHEEPSPIPFSPPKHLVLSKHPKASSVDTEIQWRKEIQESKSVHRHSSGSNPNETAEKEVMPHAVTPILGISINNRIAEFNQKMQLCQSQISASQPPASQYPQTSQAAQPTSSLRQSGGTNNPQTVRVETTEEPATQMSGQLHHSKSSSQLPKEGTLSTSCEPPKKTISPASFTPQFRGKSPPSVSVNRATAGTATVSKSDQVQHKQVSDTTDKSKRWRHARRTASDREQENVSPCPSQGHNVADADSFEEIARDRSNTTVEMEQIYNISLGETWMCSYCTNLVKTTRKDCDVCGREKVETTV